MTISDIDNLLQRRSTTIDEEVASQISLQQEEAVSSGNEELANTLWCYSTIFNIHKLYLKAYSHMSTASKSSNELVDEFDSVKSKEYEMAWNDLDQCDINISFLERCFCIPNHSMSDYHIEEILGDIKRLQPLFPYRVFTSRETLIKQQRCSICGKIVSIRHPCGHVVGKLYMGKMCGREITDMEFISENIVTTPFDKYAILKLAGQQLDFKLLDSAVPVLSPFCAWSYTTEERLLPQYNKVGRNEKCPCGSGLKFKKCIQKDHRAHFEIHYVVRVTK